MRRAIAGSLLLVGMWLGPAAAQTQLRSEIPIKDVPLDSGARLYSIPIKVGGTEIEAGLDTGSSGLRVLPDTIATSDAQESGTSDTVNYSSGLHYSGVIAKGTLAIGGFSAPITLQSVKTMSCQTERPNCPAKQMTPADVGVRGNSLTGGRFRAVLGVNMAETEIVSPLHAIGAARWIVELPHPGEDALGKLILNPTDDEVKDFVRLPIPSNYQTIHDGFHDAVYGCLLNLTTKDKTCASLLMDTGVSGINLVNVPFAAPWADGTSAAFGFYDAKGARALETFTVGLREHAALLRVTRQSGPNRWIVAGQSPYLAFDVLYDPINHQIGLRPRSVAAGGPQGTLVQGN